MKKIGFTLAEVLITLGIIGVVAALTAPALVQNAGTAKIGPTLSKVVSTLENANEQILHDEDANDLSKIAETTEEYCELLSKYISGSSYEVVKNENFISKPVTYDSSNTNFAWQAFQDLHFSDNTSILFSTFLKPSYNKKGSFKGCYALMFIDINGIKIKPNVIGKDMFLFLLDKNGQVLPWGSNAYAWVMNDDNAKFTETEGAYACNETTVTTGYGCAGSIFENNFKVIYQ